MTLATMTFGEPMPIGWSVPRAIPRHNPMAQRQLSSWCSRIPETTPTLSEFTPIGWRVSQQSKTEQRQLSSWCSRMPVATLTLSESTPIGWARPVPAAAPESMRSTAAHARRTTGRRPRPSLPMTRIVGRSALTPRQVSASASLPAPFRTGETVSLHAAAPPLLPLEGGRDAGFPMHQSVPEQTHDYEHAVLISGTGTVCQEPHHAKHLSMDNLFYVSK